MVRGTGYGDGIQIDGVGATNPSTVSSNASSGNYQYKIAIYGTASATVSDTDDTTKRTTRDDLEDLSTVGVAVPVGGGERALGSWCPAGTISDLARRHRWRRNPYFSI